MHLYIEPASPRRRTASIPLLNIAVVKHTPRSQWRGCSCKSRKSLEAASCAAMGSLPHRADRPARSAVFLTHNRCCSRRRRHGGPSSLGITFFIGEVFSPNISIFFSCNFLILPDFPVIFVSQKCLEWFFLVFLLLKIFTNCDRTSPCTIPIFPIIGNSGKNTLRYGSLIVF